MLLPFEKVQLARLVDQSLGYLARQEGIGLTLQLAAPAFLFRGTVAPIRYLVGAGLWWDGG